MEKHKNPNPPCRCENGTVFTPWITVRGHRVYRKKGKVFAFPCTRCSNNSKS